MCRPDALLCGRRLAAVALLAIALPALAAAQDQAAAPGRHAAGERSLRETLLGKFRVLPVQNGIVLVPLGRYEGVDNIELRDGTIAINGHVATGGEVRQHLGADADPVLELSYLDLAGQRRLLLTAEIGRAAPEVPSPEPTKPSAEITAPRPPEAPAPPERPFHHETEARVRLGGNVTVDEDELVNGPVVVILGSAAVNGRVKDDVVSVGGDVHLGPRAEVGGDVTVVGGALSRADGAEVGGRINEVGFAVPAVHIHPVGNWSLRFAPWFGDGPWRVFRLLGTLLRMALFALIALLVLLLVPRAVERTGEAVRTQPWKAAFVGLFAQLVFIPVLVLVTIVLAVSIIGIPLLALIPFAVLAFVAALFLGFTGAAYSVAGFGQSRLRWASTGPFVHVIVGLVLIWGVTVAGRLISLGGGPLVIMSWGFVLVGFLIEYVAWTVGLGGALMTHFGRVGPLPSATLPPPEVIPPTPPAPGGPDVLRDFDPPRE
jgi:hypothetical protein